MTYNFIYGRNSFIDIKIPILLITLLTVVKCKNIKKITDSFDFLVHCIDEDVS